MLYFNSVEVLSRCQRESRKGRKRNVTVGPFKENQLWDGKVFRRKEEESNPFVDGILLDISSRKKRFLKNQKSLSIEEET